MTISDLIASLGTYCTYGHLHDASASDLSIGQIRASSVNKNNAQQFALLLRCNLSVERMKRFTENER